jgi:polar amino acid transport system permease protein
VVLIILYNFSYLYDTLSLGIPFTGVTWASYQTINVLGQFSAVVGLTLVQSAYTAEIIRGGFLGSTTGSMKPPPRWGCPPGDALRIILPQALRTILPSGFNEIISLAKGTAMVYVWRCRAVLHHPDDLQPYPGGDPAVDGRRRLVSGDHQRLSAIQYLVERAWRRSGAARR